MDYQRACGQHPLRMPQGAARSKWRVPVSSERMPSSRMPDGEMPERPVCTEHLAIVTSPVQCWQNLYTPCEALKAGTLFIDLDLPLTGCPTAYRTAHTAGYACRRM